MNAAQRRDTIRDRKEDTKNTFRIWVKDDWKSFPIYKVPTNALILNVDNNRFGVERIQFETRLAHSFDPENSEADEASIISILLDTGLDLYGDAVKGSPSKDYESLKIDWQRRKQATPFWIRPDGSVRNGNRRLAMLKRMKNESVTGTEYVDAIILDPEIYDEHDVFEMEQREQLTEDYKVRYTDTNLLVTIKQAAIGREIDWFDEESIKRVGGEIREIAGGNQGYAIIQLRTIKYMDEYLRDGGAEDQHYKLDRQVERFRDIGKIMAKIEPDYPDESPNMLRLLFAAVRAGNTHGNIRAIWQIFLNDREKYDRLVEQVTDDEQEWDASEETPIPDPDPNPSSTSEDESEDESEEPIPDPQTTTYPGDIVRNRVKNSIDGYEASKLDVLSTLEQIVSRINSLESAGERLEEALNGSRGDEAKEMLIRIVGWLEDVKQLVP